MYFVVDTRFMVVPLEHVEIKKSANHLIRQELTVGFKHLMHVVCIANHQYVSE